MHPHSTNRFYDELLQLPTAVRERVLAQLAGVEGAALFTQALATFWSNHAEP